MTKASIYTILIATALMLSSCSTEINNESILGTWTVASVEIVSDNNNFSEDHLRSAEEKMMKFSYIFLEDDNLTTIDGGRKIEKKGGDFMLDEKRKVLTINESYNGIKLSSVLWTIEASTATSMTIFQETPGKSTTRMTLVKSK